jgi:hypothetical protein
MNNTSIENWESRLLSAARELPYPPTPDIAGQVRRRLADEARPRSLAYRRAAWAAAIVVILLLATILLVPPVRAAVLDFLQIGAVRIFLVAPTPTTTPTPALPTVTSVHSVATLLPTATPSPTPIYLASLLDLQGETTLELALDRLLFTPSIPSYPLGLGNPDRVFLQDQEGQVLFLIWTDPQQPDKVRLSLNIIGPGSWVATKMIPTVIDQTQVNGQEAFWAEGPYMMWLTNGTLDVRRLVDGHVLIWEQDGLTYRLETDLPMEEAVKIAESLTPISR